MTWILRSTQNKHNFLIEPAFLTSNLTLFKLKPPQKPEKPRSESLTSQMFTQKFLFKRPLIRCKVFQNRMNIIKTQIDTMIFIFLESAQLLSTEYWISSSQKVFTLLKNLLHSTAFDLHTYKSIPKI